MTRCFNHTRRSAFIKFAKCIVLFAAVVLLTGRFFISRQQTTGKHVSIIRSTQEVPTEGRPPSAFPSHLYHSLQEPYKSYPCLPKRLHIAQRNNVRTVHHHRRHGHGHANEQLVSMTLTFSLDYKHCKDVIPMVVYGQGGGGGGFGSFQQQQQEVVATPEARKQFNYTSDESDGLFQSDWIYHLKLDNLKAGLEQHWYQIIVVKKEEAEELQVAEERHLMMSLRGNDKKRRIVGKTKRYVFLTPPLPGSPTKLALVGDLGQTENSTKTMHHIWRGTIPSGLNRHPISQVLIAGDLSYADSDPYRWTSWMDLMEPLFRSTSLHVAAGNHEIECTTQNEIFVPYENYFYNPNRIQDADVKPISDEYKKTLWHHSCSAPSEFQGHYNYGNAFYAYEHGLVNIVVLNSYSDATVGSIQYQWLKEELQRIDRSRTPWVLVSFHSPLYTTFEGHVDEVEALNMKASMEPLFIEFGVNIVVSGHDHAYMRTHSLRYGKVDPTGKAPIYLTLGAGGNREHHASGYRHQKQEDWVAKRTLVDYGYGNLFVRNATHASFAWVRDGTADGGIHDVTWIYNRHSS